MGQNTWDPTRHEVEVQERWGDTEAYAESVRRTRSYDAQAKARISEELEAIEARFAGAMAAGHAPGSREARSVAEEARLHIDRWYYPCSHVMHAGLGRMYTSDARFRAHYDHRAEGLAAYVAAAIQANLDAQA